MPPSPTPLRSRLAGAALALLSLLAAACGTGQNRPEVVSTYPAAGSAFPGALREVRVDFDDPVSLLNEADVSVATSAGSVAVYVFQEPDEPQSIRIAPVSGHTFPVGASVTVVLDEGIVANHEEHYLADAYAFNFQTGSSGPVLLATPTGDRVVLAHPDTLAAVSSTPTPGGRDPVGVLGTELGTVARVWVQLAQGGAGAESLAWFAPGDAAMTPVALTHVGDLTAEASTLVLDSDGRTLYAAFRDAGVGLVRVARVDVATATETGSLLLSPAASPATAPLGACLEATARPLAVACRAAASDRLCRIDRDAFAEVDAGPDAGVDGLPLPTGGGPLACSGRQFVYVAPPGQASAHVTSLNVDLGLVTERPSDQLGQPVALATARDLAWLVEGLAGYVPPAGLRSYVVGASENAAVVPLLDELGGVPTGATAVRAVAAMPFADRLLVLLDTDVAAFLTWSATEVSQETPSAAPPLSTVLPLPAAAAGADVAGFFAGSTPP